MKNNIINGIVKRHPDGFGFLVPDTPDYPDLYLSRKEMWGVMTNDRVTATAVKEKTGDRYYGINVEVLERGVKRVVGVVRPQGNGDLLVNESIEKWGAALEIPYRASRGATAGDMVAVEIVDYPAKGKKFTGRVIEIIGDHANPFNDIKRVIHLQQIPDQFAAATLHEAKAIPQQVMPAEVVGRVDLRDKNFITIDGSTAKDFDDAIYVEKTKQGFNLWVAIADVSHYVRVDSGLDREAYDRGTSVYFPNMVVPMLPEELSNEICSLKPNVDRLAFTCEMAIGHDGAVTKAQVYESVICSKARVIYGEAQEILNGDSQHELAEVEKNIRLAADMANLLMAKRFREGSLDLEVPETEVLVDPLGNPFDIIKAERVFAHKLIEELMLIANVSVAKLIIAKEQPGIFRVHEAPNSEDIAKLQTFLQTFGSTKKLSGGQLQKKLTDSLHDFKGKPQGTILNILTLRSMCQAKYSPHNIGHFGLGFADYAHFTSPIRRYPDLLTHRILKALYTQSRAGQLYTEEKLTSAGTFLSACEQRAVKADRMVMAIKKARFMSDKVGEVFTGVISSVAKFGLFVLLRQYDVDGLIKIDQLGGDQFEFNDEHLFLSGKRTKKIYRIGDTIEILVAAVNTDEGQIDFVLAKEAKSGDPTTRNAQQNGQRGRTHDEKFAPVRKKFNSRRSAKKSKAGKKRR